MMSFTSVSNTLEDMNILGFGDKFAGLGDTCSCLQFVSSQHPNLDPSIPQGLQRLSDVVLQLVLHPSHAEQLHVALQTLHHCSNLNTIRKYLEG